MNKWVVEYEPVKAPDEDKRGWHFPFQGGDWPASSGWYWVWGKPTGYASGRYLRPIRGWWDNEKQKFCGDADYIVAWHKAVRIE